MLDALRDDSLSARDDGFVLRLSLPWIRSLPLSSLADLTLSADGAPVAVQFLIGDRLVPSSSIADEHGWWFVQDRLVVRGTPTLASGPHHVDVQFDLIVPYLQSAPDAPLRLHFSFERMLTLDAGASRPSVSHDVA